MIHPWIMLPALFTAALATGTDLRAADPVLPPAVPMDWWHEVQAGIAASEYEVSVAGASLQAPNRAQNLRACFLDDGVRLAPRDEDDPTWTFGMTLAAIGRPDALRAPAPARRTHDGNRVEYGRDGLVEWYVNDPRGLEQGFTLDAAPAGAGELRLDLAIDGSLVGVLSTDRSATHWFDENGVHRLALDHLIVVDAESRRLPAHFELVGGTLSILVDDADAAYPIIIDPLATTPAATLVGGQAAAHFGTCVATAGDVNGDGYSDVIVGAPEMDVNGNVDQGRVFVFHGSATGLVTTPAFEFSSPNAGDLTGFAVTTAGDVDGDGYADVLFGAHGYSVTATNAGRYYVFYGSPSGIQAAGSQHVGGAVANTYLGITLAAAGDVNGDGYDDIAAGRPQFGAGGTVILAYGSASGIGDPLAWTAAGTNGEQFGFSVSGAGDVDADGFSDLLVGAPGADGTVADIGRVALFHGSAAGLATSPAQEFVPTVSNTARFGRAVAGVGDVNGDGYSDFVVGANELDSNGVDSGSIFIYTGGPSGAALSWTFDGAFAGAELGFSVATAGDVNGDGYADILAGARAKNTTVSGGEAYLWLGSSAGPVAAPEWTYAAGGSGWEAGYSVATAGDVNGDGYSDVLIGAPKGIDQYNAEGIALLFLGCATVPGKTASWTLQDQPYASLGQSIGPAGDVNGDGYDDVIIGEPLYDSSSGGDEGKALLFAGSDSAIGSTPMWAKAEGSSFGFITGQHYGWSVSTAGDVNGDGYDDTIVSHPWDYQSTQSGANAGEVHVYHGSPTGPSNTPGWVSHSYDVGSPGSMLPQYGFNVGTAGDVNGDGYADIFISSVNANNPDTSIFVFHGTPDGLGTHAAHSVETFFTATSVACAGDVNGDGFSDLIIGEAGQPLQFSTPKGEAYVHYGSSNGLKDWSSGDWYVSGAYDGGKFGQSVAGAGDVNGDGYSDVIVGAPKENDRGRAYLYLGSATGLAKNPAWVTEGAAYQGLHGNAVATAGDVNADGYSDVLVAAPQDARVLLYLGGPTGLAPTAAWQKVVASVDFGTSVSTAGDLNGDGFADILVGAPIGNNGNGIVYAYYGNESGVGARPRALHAYQPDDSQPIPWMGASKSTAFRVHAKGFSPFGRAHVALEVEAKPRGTPFDGVGTTVGPFQDTGPGAIDLNELVDGLQFSTNHHWRTRVRYSGPMAHYLPAGPWFSPARAGRQESTLRTSCANSATKSKYGTAKPGTNGVPTLDATKPSTGKNMTLTIKNGLAGAQALLCFGLSSASIPFDGGKLLVQPLAHINLPLNASGALSFPAPIAADPALCGLELYLQVLIPDPGAAGFYHTAQSKGLKLTFGS